MATLLPVAAVLRVQDRDGRIDQAIADLTGADPTLQVLAERDLENYLLSDEVLEIGSQEYATDPAEAIASLLRRRLNSSGTKTYERLREEPRSSRSLGCP